MHRSVHIALVSLLFSLISSLLIYFIARIAELEYDFGFLFLFLFVSFVLSWLFFYFSYEMSLNRRIKNITDRVKLLSKREKDPPQILVNLPEEKQDPLLELDNEINHLESVRQQEIEKLLKLENHRKEFLGNVSHELKTPIFNIQGYVSTLIDGGIYDESINIDYLKRADKSVDRMIHIVGDLEQISQLESGVLELDYEIFDITELVRDVFTSLEIQAKSRQIYLEMLNPNMINILVYADKFRIRQVLVNLITNAIKYGKDTGKISIDFLDKDNNVSVFVSDNGIGIEEVHLPRLFERFYRVDKGRSRAQGGSGLGLAIVKHIIEAHHQQIKVSSKVGEGTTFTFGLVSGFTQKSNQ